MPHAEHTVTVDRPAEIVFAYLADGLHNREWRDGVLEIERTSSTTELGAYHQVLSGPGGRKVPGDYRVTTYEVPRRLDFEVADGPLRPTGRFEVTSVGPEQSTVRFTLDATPTGVMKLMAPMIGKQMQREVAGLDKLRKILEQRA